MLEPGRTEQAANSGEDVIGHGLTCVRCRYELHGLSTTGRCPECGLEIAHTLESTSMAQPKWVGRVARGVALFYWVALFAVQVAGFGSSRGTIFLAALPCLMTAAVVWLISGPDRTRPYHEPSSQLKWLALLLVVLLVLLHAFRPEMLGLRMGGTGASLVELGLILACVVLCLDRMAHLARQFGAEHLARPLWIACGLMTVSVLVPLLIRRSQFLRGLFFLYRPDPHLSELYLLAQWVHVGLWAYALLLMGRMLGRLHHLRGHLHDHADSLPPDAAKHLRRGLLGLLALPVVLYSTWLWGTSQWWWIARFAGANILYSIGLYYLWRSGESLSIPRWRRRGMLLSLVALVAATIAYPLLGLLFGGPWYQIRVAVSSTAWALAIACTIWFGFNLIGGFAATAGEDDLAAALRARAAVLAGAVLALWVFVRAVLLTSGMFEQMMIVFEGAVWMVMLCAFEAMLLLGRAWQTTERQIVRGFPAG